MAESISVLHRAQYTIMLITLPRHIAICQSVTEMIIIVIIEVKISLGALSKHFVVTELD